MHMDTPAEAASSFIDFSSTTVGAPIYRVRRVGGGDERD
jgi:hypothetical protein